jgi:SAM-dependent methyltransferase
VGCGDKPYESIFRPYVTEYVGIEHEATFRLTSASLPPPGSEDGDRGRKPSIFRSASGSGRSQPDYLYDGRSLPFESKSFDTVICIEVLEHTPDPQNLLNEIARVVKSDGIVVLSAPFSMRLHEEPHDYFRYTPHGFRELFARAGLDIEKLSTQGDLWSVVGHKINSFLAFRVARVGAIARMLGKLGHEGPQRLGPRYWIFPVVFPAMASVSLGARVLDRIAPDGTEALGHLIIAHPRRAD